MADVFRIQGTYELQDRVTEQLEKVQKKVKTTNDELDKSENKWSKFSKNLSDVGKNITSFGKTLTLGVTAPIIAAGSYMFKTSADMVESISKVGVVFEQNSSDVEAWSKTTLDAFGISQNSALEYASLFGDMSKSMGLTDEQTKTYSTSLVELAGDLASFKNISVDRANTALAGIYTGETEALKSLGIVMTEANLEQYALSKGITTSIKDMTQAEKVQLRYGYVMDMSKDAVGDFARTSDSAGNQMRSFPEAIKELSTTIGNDLLPMFTPIITKVNDFIKGLKDMSPETRQMIIKIGGLAAIAGPLLVVVGNLCGAVGNITKLFGFFTPVATGAAAATTGVGTATTVATAPIWLIIGAIALFVAGILYLWKTNEGFRTAIMNIWDRIKFIIENVCNGIKVFWDTWGTEITGIWNWLWDSIGGVLTNAINVITGILDFFVALFTGNWEGMKTAVMNIAESLVLGLLSMFGLSFDSLTDAAQYFSNVFTGIWDGILGGVKWVVNGIIDGINWAIKGINSLCSMDFPDVVNDFGIPDFNLNIPTVPKWYSEGAIFTQRTILQNGSIGVGDADNGKGDNPEAILPIDKLRGMIQDLLQVNIQMLIDGKEFVSEVVAPHQNQLNNYNQKRNIARAY